MADNEPMTISAADAQWQSLTFRAGEQYVHGVGGGVLPDAPRCPDRRSLQRRHAACDTGWMATWLQDDDDACTPR